MDYYNVEQNGKTSYMHYNDIQINSKTRHMDFLHYVHNRDNHFYRGRDYA